MKDYLILTTIGKTNHWRNWLQKDRKYDIALVYYENDMNYEHIKNKVEYFWHNPDFKYPSLKKIIDENKYLLNYKYIWMPDDDIVVNTGSINQLFEWADKLNISLFQPSIIPKNYTWPVTVHKRNSEFRYVSMVEIMCPGFRGDVLEKIYDTFNESWSGWGLEWAWVNKSGEKEKSIAIYDKVIIEHKKHIQLNGGRLYEKLMNEKGLTPHQEMHKMIRKYPIKNKHFSQV